MPLIILRISIKCHAEENRTAVRHKRCSGCAATIAQGNYFLFQFCVQCTLSLASFTSNEMLNFVFRFSFSQDISSRSFGLVRLVHNLQFSRTQNCRCENINFGWKSVPNASVVRSFDKYIFRTLWALWRTLSIYYVIFRRCFFCIHFLHLILFEQFNK